MLKLISLLKTEKRTVLGIIILALVGAGMSEELATETASGLIAVAAGVGFFLNKD